MIRIYSDARIYKNFKIARCLSIVSLVLAIVTAIIHACVYFTRVPDPSEEPLGAFYLVLFYFFTISIPIMFLLNAVKWAKPSTKDLHRTINETKWNNDFANVLTTIILSFVPYILLVFYGFLFLCFGTPNVASWGRLYGYMLPSHAFVYIADVFLIINCVFMRREWKDDPPEYLKRKQHKKAKQQTENAKREAQEEKQRKETQCHSLLQKCGMRFFIKYYQQIKTLPLRDVVLSETYSSEEKEERLNAAKQIIDLNLTAVALNTMITVYGNSLDNCLW